jgi:histidine triad (HIT) family protein
MSTSALKNYICPICLGNTGVENENTMLKQADLVFRDELTSVWINSLWLKGNEGHVIIVPNTHYENIYDLPADIGHRIFDVAKKIALAIKKAYECNGITLRQNNEAAGDQHALHYHLHIFPRYTGDSFNQNLTKKSVLADPEERKRYVAKLQKSI